MSELIRQIALVSQSNLIPRADVSKVAAAIQKQATRDLAPIWSVSATVDAFDALDDVPIGYWPLVVMDNINTPGAAGIHEDNNGQPFALISASADLDVWSLTASHEALEMLVDPFGRRMVAGDAPADSGQGRVSYLVEVCDPCESATFAYSSNGIRVSDFYTPAFFDPVAANGVQYSFTGALKGPRQVLQGGYLSWQDPETGIWWQATKFNGDQQVIRRLGQLDLSGGTSARSAVDALTTPEATPALARPRAASLLAGRAPAVVAKSTSARATMWRRSINQIVGREALAEPASGAAPISGQSLAQVLGAAGASGAAPAYDAAQATLLGQFVEAAYTMFGDNPGNLLPPASANFPSGYRLIAAVQMSDFVIGSTGPLFYGFVAQQEADASRFVLALRGTIGDIEWWDDFISLGMIPFRVQGCGSVGAGFGRIYDSIAIVEYPTAAAVAAAAAPAPTVVQGSLADKMAALVARHRPATGLFGAAAAVPPTVAVTGHSLGSALATLYVLENVKRQLLQSPVICTFASPRVGDSTFVGAFNALGLQSWRFANTSDIVPLLPPQLLGFEHVNALISLSSTGKVQPNLGCWHALETYLSLIDPALQPSSECQLPPHLQGALASPALPPSSASPRGAALLAEEAGDGSQQLATAMAAACGGVNRNVWVQPLLDGFAKFGLNTNRRRAAAMGQFLVEAGSSFREVVENLNYSAARAAVIFPSIFPTAAAAAPFAHNQEKFGNHVYANRLGNGNEASGDGFRFRGRGLIQLTGRNEYTEFGNAIGKSPEEVSDFCETPEGAAMSGCWYLATRGCLPFADAWNIDKITLRVNGRAMVDKEKRLAFSNAFLSQFGSG
jgi:predicted chitinase